MEAEQNTFLFKPLKKFTFEGMSVHTDKLRYVTTVLKVKIHRSALFKLFYTIMSTTSDDLYPGSILTPQNILRFFSFLKGFKWEHSVNSYQKYVACALGYM